MPLAALTRDAVLKAIGEFDALDLDELGQSVARARTAESAAATGVVRSLPWFVVPKSSQFPSGGGN
jgi:hypothetical protein